MPLATRFADFLHDLQQPEKAAVHAHGSLILEAFTRHSPYDEGAVWLREARGSGLRLAALLRREGASFKAYRAFGEVEIGDELLREIAAKGEAVSLDDGTIVAVPIKGNNEIIGVLAAAERETRDGGVAAFEANELRLL